MLFQGPTPKIVADPNGGIAAGSCLLVGRHSDQGSVGLENRMPGISRRLKMLEKQLAELDGDEAMLLTELDGFLAGILVCPDLIMPGEWLPIVCGGGNKEAAPVFENTKQAEQLVGLIMERYNAVAATFSAGPATTPRCSTLIRDTMISSGNSGSPASTPPYSCALKLGPKCRVAMRTRAGHWQALSPLCRSAVAKARFRKNRSTT